MVSWYTFLYGLGDRRRELLWILPAQNRCQGWGNRTMVNPRGWAIAPLQMGSLKPRSDALKSFRASGLVRNKYGIYDKWLISQGRNIPCIENILRKIDGSMEVSK
jgi:hypothetical protein